MSVDDYLRAQKLGKREYQSRLMRGLQPTLEVLDDILPPKGSYSEVPLGLVQIPSDQIVGTKTEGRSNAFASNFMPILKQNTEFARKWDALSTSHLEEGIREPIKAYEYLNKFYVQEGNKRVSVSKYFDVDAIPGVVTRIVPKRTNEKENVIYYEYMDFYSVSKVNYLYMSKVGNFPKLQAVMGKEPGEEWTDADKQNFSSIFYRFQLEYKAKGGEKLSITQGDAFLAFVTVYGYQELLEKTTSELNDLIAKSWEEFLLLEKEDVIDLKMNPTNEKKPLLSRILPVSAPRLKVAFIYAKTPASSAWIYAHELGRLYLEQAFPEEISTFYYDNATQENIDDLIETAINCGSNIIFTTSPSFAQASVKAATENPEVRILNCSLNTSHRYIRTYYARMHEAKFLMGALAGALTTNDKLAYVADYPIYGSIANINAFALGAKMINPRVKVYLEWSSMKNVDIAERLKEIGAGCISGKDMVIPEESTREFGLYTIEGDHTRRLAMPLWHWGKFYEQLIRTIMDGTWKYDDSGSDKKAINYWWGMSAGVIDVICSNNTPIGTKRLIDLLKKNIVSQQFSPFSGILYSQDGIVQADPKRTLTPEEIITMDWLAENIIGIIPKTEDLQEQARPVTLQQGVNKEKGQI